MTSARLINGQDYGLAAEGQPNARSGNFEHFASPQGVMAAMYPYMYQDVNFKLDDFDAFELDTTYWDSLSDDASIWELDKGYAEARTGLADNNGISLFGLETLRPNKNCGVEFRWQVDVVTNLQLELGFINALTDDLTLPIISDIDTPAAVTGNTGAVFHIDTDQTLTTAALVVSSNDSSTVAKSNIGTFAPTADNWYTVRVHAVFDNSAGYTAFVRVFDTNAGRPVLVASGKQTVASATAASSYYRPWVLVRNRSAAEKIFKLDYAARWQDRGAI